MRLVACLSYVYNDKEGNDRLSWPRFNTSTYEEKVRARNAKSRAYFSILHFQTPCADQFVHAKVQSLLRLSELLEFEAVQFANFASSSPSSQIVRLYSRTLLIWSGDTQLSRLEFIEQELTNFHHRLLFLLRVIRTQTFG